jgi:hypothetical protein
MISEERLRQAAHHAGTAVDEHLANLEIPASSPSLAFENKMANLIRHTKRRRKHPVLRRVACILLVCLLGSGLWLGVNAQARATVFGWMIDHTPRTYHYSFSSETVEDSSQVRYVLPEIPDGYEPVDLCEEENLVSNFYANEAGYGFSFGYIVGDGAELFLDTEEIEAQQVYVLGHPAEFYQAASEEEGSTLVWRDSTTDTLFYMSGFFDQEYLISLAETVIQEKN